ncbi:tol-pal system-associated acyl-CoA thioesterase [Sphingomonas paeninsulae]|uniref:Tol-pal system-associated acyl-CoA thioesterase n=1 Tax=Sphingomonas paeninsulae TaxID=2319844 RepID=A0A494TLT1_SPHPE|nr:tol-pal system-associated acyl-CoA thioesterase [Sphingomonas paeninsulae]AYJ86771.1 tol-pal system-associated acyl-CoA thioesterase [Sphingomonas paeninsulae]
MVNDIPPAGRFEGASHRFPVRVYFEDTDLSGVVYHANYLRYMERARSDMLRALGIEQRAAFDAGEGVYAVSALAIRYRRPARLDEDLTVVSHVVDVGAATATIHQTVMRADEILTEAEVTAAFLTLDGKPRRQPKEWVVAFARLNQEN